MIKLIVQTEEVYADEDRKPIPDDRITKEVTGKSGQLELKEWVLSCETWEEIMQFVKEHGGSVNIEVPEDDEGLGSMLLLGA